MFFLQYIGRNLAHVLIFLDLIIDNIDPTFSLCLDYVLLGFTNRLSHK